MKRSRLVLILVYIAVALCAVAFFACARSGYENVSDVPDIKKNEVLFIERNRLSFALDMDIDEEQVIEDCNITFTAADGSTLKVTKALLSNGTVKYDGFALDSVGSNKRIAISYNGAENYIYYDVNSYTASFYLDEGKSELYKTVKASAELTDSLGLSVWVNLINQNFSTDEDMRHIDERRTLKFDGWSDYLGNRATGLYLFAAPERGNEVEVDFTANYISDEEADELALHYDDAGRRVFDGYAGESSSVRVPEGVDYIDFNKLFKNGSPVKELRLPSTAVIDLPLMSGINSLGLEKITVDGGNRQFASYNGAVYSKDYSTLYFMPSDCDNKEFHSSLTEIGSYSCAYWRETSLDIPESVTTLQHYCFAHSHLTEVNGIDNVKTIKAGIFYGARTAQYSDGTAQYIVLDGEDAGGLILSMMLDETVEEYTLAEGTVAISSNAFSRCKNLKKVIFNEGLKSISGSAFSGCTALESVELPSTLEKMGSNVFYGCKKLTSVTGLPSVTYVDDSGREYANCLPTGIFYGCSVLKDAPLPDGLLQISHQAFYQCTLISDVKIPDTVTYIGQSVFGYCKALKKLDLPASLRSFGSSVFYESGLSEIDLSPCTSLTSLSASLFRRSQLKEITIPDRITALPDNCLREISTLKKVNLNKVTTLGDYAVGQNSKLTDINYGALVTIGTNAFRSCTTLASVELPETVTDIGGYAFGQCSALTTLSLGKNVKIFGDYPVERDGVSFGAISPVMWACRKLTSITVAEGNEYFKDIGGVLYGRYVGDKDYGEDGVLYCLPCAYAKVSYTTEATTRVILPYAVHYQTTLTAFTCNDGLENIGKAAFYYSTKLVTLNISPSVTTIGANIILNCTKASTFTIGEGNSAYSSDGDMVYTGDKLVLAAGAPKTVTIRQDTKTIAMGAFMNTAITDIVIPDSVETLEEKAFNGCSKLKNLTIGKGLRNIDPTAFSALQSLETVTVSADNPYFTAEDGALYTKDGKGLVLVAACNGWTEVKIKSSVTEIWDYAFSYHKTLASIVLPENVKSVGEYSFYDCRSAEYLFCNRRLESIGVYAFGFSSTRDDPQLAAPACCKTMQFIVFYENISYIGDNAFYGHYGIKMTCFKMTERQREMLMNGAGSNSIFFTHGCSNGVGGYHNNDGAGIVRALYSENEPTIILDGYEWFHWDDDGKPVLHEVTAVKR